MNRDLAAMDELTPERSSSGRSVIAVIGIDRYRAMPPLDNAVGDARGVLRLFQQLGFEPATEPLLDEAATAAAMARLVTDDLATLGADDSLVLFFAGHGETKVRAFPDGVIAKTGYLIPVDADGDRSKVASWVKLDSWLDDVARLPPRHILVILDACRSGIALSPLVKWRGGQPAAEASLDPLRRRRSRRIITSALDDELAMDGGPVPGHSLFTGCLIEALTGGLASGGRTVTTGSELGVYVRHRVTTYPGARQTPDFGALALDNRGEMVIRLLGAGSSIAIRDGAAAREAPVAAPGPGAIAHAAEPPHEPVVEPAAAHADALILAATPLEFDAVLQVDAGAAAGSSWELAAGPSGLPIAFRSFVAARRPPLRVAVAVSSDPGATAATQTLLPLAGMLRPRCIAMCGICVGRRDETQLGDVVVADRVFYHDTGKQLSDEIQRDLTTYKLRDDWKTALERLDAAAQFRGADWFQARPVTAEWRERRALVALRDGASAPWAATDPALDARGWQDVLVSLRRQGLLSAAGRKLTEKGLQFIDDLLFDHMGKLPDLSPAATSAPFRLHVGPIASGAKVMADEAIWAELSQVMYKTLGIETEAAALGELAHRQRQYRLDAVVMKGVASFADQDREDRFAEFAARASAECLLWFLREHVER